VGTDRNRAVEAIANTIDRLAGESSDWGDPVEVEGEIAG